MILLHVNESRNDNGILHGKCCQTSNSKWSFKLDGFKHVLQFCFLSFIIPRVYAHPRCQGMKILENAEITCDIIDNILDTHNRIRQSVAEGSIIGQPPAANMRELYWDFELASGAQNWANQCVFAHNDPKDREVERFRVGQNIGLVKITRRNHSIPKIEFPKQIDKWFSEHQVYQFGAINEEILQLAGHYTQLIWANTYLVGCGYSQYKMLNNTIYQFYICHYGPTGNEFDELPYVTGNRSCDYVLKTSDKYPNLCGLKDIPVSCT